MEARPLLSLDGIPQLSARLDHEVEDVGEYLARASQERARLLDAAADARAKLTERRSRLADAVALQERLSRQVLDAERSIASRRSDADAKAAAIVETAGNDAETIVARAKAAARDDEVRTLRREIADLETAVVLSRAEADILEGVIDVAFGLDEAAGTTAERQLQALLDDWRRSSEQESRAALDGARALADATLRVARIEAGEIAGVTDAAGVPAAAWPAPEPGSLMLADHAFDRFWSGRSADGGRHSRREWFLLQVVLPMVAVVSVLSLILAWIG